MFASFYFFPSVLVAILAAYAHELNHVFSGHLTTHSSIAQESHSDYIGGSVTWAWLRDRQIQDLCGISSQAMAPFCAFGLLHLLSVLSDKDHDATIYLPRMARLLIYGGGAAFYAESTTGKESGNMMEAAMRALPACPDPGYQSAHIDQQYQVLESQLSEELATKLATVLTNMPGEKRLWYNASVHLKQIKKDLQRGLKRDAR